MFSGIKDYLGNKTISAELSGLQPRQEDIHGASVLGPILWRAEAQIMIDNLNEKAEDKSRYGTFLPTDIDEEAKPGVAQQQAISGEGNIVTKPEDVIQKPSSPSVKV